MMRTLREKGWTVYAIAPRGRYVKPIESTGAVFVPWHVSGRSINPIAEMRSLFALVRIYRLIRPSVAHHFTIKPKIYGAIASRLARVPTIIASVTGLGYPLTGNTWKARAIGSLIRPIHRFAYRSSDVVTFQNMGDRDLLVAKNYVPAAKTYYMPGGSGVDLTIFHPNAPKQTALASLRRDLGLPNDAVVIALIARMLWEKGVAEYRECARELRNRHHNARFLLVGPTEDGVTGYVPLRQLKKWTQDSTLIYLGERQDVREILALADVVVLPTYYGEGVPRILLEASAMARPVVSTDAPSCREAVEHGVTGLLVPPRNNAALNSAVERLIVDGELRKRFGSAARGKAEREFDEHKIIAQFLTIYESLWGQILK